LATVLKTYEVTFIINPDFDEEKTQAVLKDIKDTIEGKGGRVLDVDVWGKRRLAYEIDGYKTGFFIVITFEGPSDTPPELERVLRINDEILRHMVIRDED